MAEELVIPHLSKQERYKNVLSQKNDLIKNKILTVILNLPTSRQGLPKKQSKYSPFYLCFDKLNMTKLYLNYSSRFHYRYPILKITGVILVVFLLHSCAQPAILSGGDKDTAPPKELVSVPKNGDANFSSQTIVIEFDEFIRLQKLYSQLIISPLMETRPDISVKGKKLIIKLNSELTPNTTYSINFGDAIKDITENNALPNYKYVFSTGPTVDSLSYTGTILNAFTLAKEDGFYVMLYDLYADSVPLKRTPRYLSKTNKQGQFTITNIAKGKYKLFVLKDINSNYLFDLPNEEIGFKEELISIDTSLSNNIIYSFKEDHEKQFLKHLENKTYGKLSASFNLPTKNMQLTPIGYAFKKQWFIEEKSASGTSITYWLSGTEGIDSLSLIFTEGTSFTDTAHIELVKKEPLKDTLLPFSSNTSATFDLNKNIILTAETPVIRYNTDSIQLFEDSTLVQHQLIFNDTALRRFNIEYPFKENTNYSLHIPPKTFEDIYGRSNNALNYQFKSRKISYYGNIFLSLSPDFTEDYIIQLHTDKNTLVEEYYLKGTQEINFLYLSSGNYKLTLIVDNNANKKWDTGNYLNHLQPEKLIKYTEVITIRSNWDNDLIWNINSLK